MSNYQKLTKSKLIDELETLSRTHQQTSADFEALKTQFADQTNKCEKLEEELAALRLRFSELDTRCREIDEADQIEKQRREADAAETEDPAEENAPDNDISAEDADSKEIGPQIFDAVIEASGRRQILLTEDGRIAFITNAAARDMGITEPQNLMGRNFFEFLNPGHAEKFVDKAKNALTKQKSKHCKVSFHSHTKSPQSWEIKIKHTKFRERPALLLTLKK
jgi:PAS domain-containing protein